MVRRVLRYLIIAVVAVTLASLLLPRRHTATVGRHRDYAEIAGDTLRVVTEYNDVGFYIDGDSLDGFHYRLIEDFARTHGLELLITPEMDIARSTEGLADGRYDIMALGLHLMGPWRDSFLLTKPVAQGKEVLVQRRPYTHGDSAAYIRSALDLMGRTLHVVKGSPSLLRLHNLSDEIGDTIYVEEVERYGAEQLIAMVAHGDIDYVVCDESLARRAAMRMDSIDVETDIGFTRYHSWAVSRQSPALLDSLNAWIERFRDTRRYKRLHKTYYGY